ncbi:MAG: hypothetical protein QXK34_01295 [Candidatus Bathyarchaeia archaeon]
MPPKTVERAYEYLRNRFGLKPSGGAVDRLLERFLASGRPALKPYHLDPPDPILADALSALRGPLYIEAKYDGTHILLCPNGIFKHDGNPVASDQLAGLMHIAAAEPDAIEGLLSASSEYHLALELFGSAYTPMGVHKDHPKPFSAVAFEVGVEGGWIPPPEKYEVLEGLGIDFARPELEYRPAGYQALMEELGARVRGIAGEGIVAKGDVGGYIPRSDYERAYIKAGGLLAFKFKKPEYKAPQRRGAKVAPRIERAEARLYELPGDASEEVFNELNKMRHESGDGFLRDPRNIPAILERVSKHLREDHPGIWGRLSEGMSERDFRKAVVAILRRHFP